MLAQVGAAETALLPPPEEKGGPEWLQDLRRRGRERFLETGFPGPDDEPWRFTSLKPLQKTEFRPLPPTVPDPDPAWIVARTLVPDLAHRVILVNGASSEPLSSPADSGGGGVVSLARILREEPEILQHRLGRVVDTGKHRFSALNTAFLDEGVVVVVPGGTRAEPIHLVLATGGGGTPFAVHPRVLLVVEDGAEATVLEEHLGMENEVYFSNPVTEILVGRNASLSHIRVLRESDRAFHIGSVSARVERDGRFASCALSLGARLSRVDVDVVLDGEGAETALDGLYLAGGRQHVDHHTHVDHARPHTVSRELYKGVMNDRATAVFNGRVLIRPGAQKIEASQTNNNLLLSPEALVNTNPELEILADDVKAQHGATIGQLDENQLFYLRSRGIDRGTARHLLILAFAGEMLDRVGIPEARSRLTEFLNQRF